MDFYRNFFNNKIYCFFLIIDIIGVVIHAYPPREIPTVNGPQRIQELLLVDQEYKYFFPQFLLNRLFM